MDTDDKESRRREVAELQARLDALKGEASPAQTLQQKAAVGCAVVGAVIVLVVFIAALSTCSGNDANGGKQPEEPQASAPPATPAATAPPQVPPELARRCGIADCPAGSVVVTAAAKDGPFFGCRSEALSDYVNFVLGLVAMQNQVSGSVPNIDPETGEPVYQGETKEMLSAFRSKAGVETFDQAAALCAKGPYRHRVTVLNWMKDRSSTWVANGTSGKSFWVPTTVLELPASRK